ncbi:DUF5959 family protein [Streptomyces sp. NPDC029006]|uniref:DUF5959 family protein n=1 Tax=Streptomyces sp. NPDC029006 TaxID=3155467 RepID=UPI0033CEDC91
MATLEEWAGVLDRLDAVVDVAWVEVGRGPSLLIQLTGERGCPGVVVEDESGSMVTVRVPLVPPGDWIADHRQRLRRVMDDWFPVLSGQGGGCPADGRPTRRRSGTQQGARVCLPVPAPGHGRPRRLAERAIRSAPHAHKSHSHRREPQRTGCHVSLQVPGSPAPGMPSTCGPGAGSAPAGPARRRHRARGRRSVPAPPPGPGRRTRLTPRLLSTAPRSTPGVARTLQTGGPATPSAGSGDGDQRGLGRDARLAHRGHPLQHPHVRADGTGHRHPPPDGVCAVFRGRQDQQDQQDQQGKVPL